MLFGWNLNQWSLAAGRHARIVGDLPPATPDGAIHVQSWWRASYPDVEPGEVTLDGVKPERQRDWAIRAVSLAFEQVHPGVKP